MNLLLSTSLKLLIVDKDLHEKPFKKRLNGANSDKTHYRNLLKVSAPVKQKNK